MKMKTFLIAMVSLLVTSQIFAGIIIQEMDMEDSTMTTFYMQSNKAKVVSSNRVFMFNVDNGKIYLIFPEKKVYWIGKPEEIAESVEKFKQKSMDEYLSKMTPEQKKAYEQYMKQQDKTVDKKAKKKTDVSINKTSEKANIAGYSTYKYKVFVNGKLEEELWVSPNIKFENEIDIDKMENLMSKFSKAMGEDEDSYTNNDEYKKYTIRNYPLKRIHYRENGKSVTITKSVLKKKIDDSIFKIPDDCKKTELIELMKMGM
jgi:hypothetical protein